MLVAKRIFINKRLMQEIEAQYNIVNRSKEFILRPGEYSEYANRFINMPLSYVLYGKNKNNPDYMIGVSYEKNEYELESIQYFPVVINKKDINGKIIKKCIYSARNKCSRLISDNEGFLNNI